MIVLFTVNYFADTNADAVITVLLHILPHKKSSKNFKGNIQCLYNPFQN
jgi:hypothetical protein